jgi:hypothetical protein
MMASIMLEGYKQCLYMPFVCLLFTPEIYQSEDIQKNVSHISLLIHADWLIYGV